MTWTDRYDGHPCHVFAWTAFTWMWQCIGHAYACGQRERFGAP